MFKRRIWRRYCSSSVRLGGVADGRLDYKILVPKLVEGRQQAMSKLMSEGQENAMHEDRVRSGEW